MGDTPIFYPFNVRFGYREAGPEQFQKDLKKIRPLLDEMMAERSNTHHGQFKRGGSYQLLRAGMVDRWDILNELRDYPNMLELLSIA